MGILWTILVGLVVGILAKLIYPGRQNMGFILTVLLGIGGSLLATYAGRAAGFYQPGQAAGLIAGILGAIVILLVYSFVKKKSA